MLVIRDQIYLTCHRLHFHQSMLHSFKKIKLWSNYLNILTSALIDTIEPVFALRIWFLENLTSNYLQNSHREKLSYQNETIIFTSLYDVIWWQSALFIRWKWFMLFVDYPIGDGIFTNRQFYPIIDQRNKAYVVLTIFENQALIGQWHPFYYNYHHHHQTKVSIAHNFSWWPTQHLQASLQIIAKLCCNSARKPRSKSH